jgi:organic hydroperoxide reductase OsmC/OhrA
MQRYEARISWSRGDAKFVDNKYGRGHEWAFDGGVKVPASASPLSVRAPFSVAEAVDPEEAVVAAASSCHMLWFLWFAANKGFVVDRYVDEPFGVMEKNANGKLVFTRITLRPGIDFSGDRRPSDAELESLHHSAHEECSVAQSLRCEVVVEKA